jgi:enamine deaminase RidA (YjgF/YER057c/UK114 family)
MISPVSESAYSKAVVAKYGTLLFISGQESIDKDGRLIAPGDFTGQTQQVWNNMRDILEKAGGELDNVATMTVYTTERRWGRQFTGAISHEHETAYGDTLRAIGRPKGEDMTMEITTDKFVLFTQPG